jgi:sialate O-acetylesterase
VTVTLGGDKQTATAGADGKWMVRMNAVKASDPATEMTIAGKNTVTIKDILIGEVWVASGQSNMAFTVSKAHASYAGLVNEEEEIKNANYPQIRMFTPKSVKAYEPQPDLEGEWKICSPETVGDFSAVGYLFARDLQRELKLPVGIVTLAFGASTAEAWVSREAMSADPALKPMLDSLDASVKYYRADPQGPPAEAPVRPTPINKPRQPVRRLTDPVQDQHFPTVLYNGMIAPAIPFAMRGAIWYQGESIIGGDAGLSLYPHTMDTLVRDWRARWGEGDFPFYAVQLPPLRNISNNPRVREGQARILSLPNTGLAVTMDIGDPRDVHPHNKAPLGERLTRIALAGAYGKPIEAAGPVYESMKAEGKAIRVKLAHSEGLAAKDGGALKWFRIAGDDKKFVDAEAKIDGDSILVSSPEVAAPVAVRYAWDNYPEGCNLVNGAGLPAAPFRTDDWAYPIEGLVE